MKTYTVGDLKTNFSQILECVRAGEEIAIAFGQKKEIVAYLVPRSARPDAKRQLGLLAEKAQAVFQDDFTITEAEFLNL